MVTVSQKKNKKIYLKNEIWHLSITVSDACAGNALSEHCLLCHKLALGMLYGLVFVNCKNLITSVPFGIT